MRECVAAAKLEAAKGGLEWPSVAAGTKHGATLEIAEAIGRELNSRGVDAHVAQLGAVESVDAYDAVVLGSAVYMGRWVDLARAFVERNAAQLAGRPTWLFSSGPVGEPLRPADVDAVNVDDVVDATNAKDHRLFGGKVDRSRLGIGERAVMRAVGASDGDYRDWAAIRERSAGIARWIAESKR